MPTCPNKFPAISHPLYRLAIVGEAPGQDEITAQEPFVGTSGKLLRLILGSCNLAPDQVFLGNVCQHQPFKNDIETFDWDGPELRDGQAQLRADLTAYQPHAVLSLGRTPLRAFRPDLCYPSKRGMAIPIGNWRGSVFKSSWGYKTIACFHPAYIQRSYADIPFFRFDVARAVAQSRDSLLPYASRVGLITPTLDQVVIFLRDLRSRSASASFDIEGYPDDKGVTCISICPTPFEGIVIPFWHNGNPYWSDMEEPIIWSALAEYLADASCPKTCHNGFYESFVLAWKHRCLICGWSDDTMLGFKELYLELDKNLGVVNSMCTLEPYYKDDRLSSDPIRKLEYNFKDSAVTEESKRAIVLELQKEPRRYEHYQFNIRIAPAITFLNLRGCRLDLDRLAAHVHTETGTLGQLQSTLDSQVLAPALAADILTRKRKSDPWTFNVKSVDQKRWLLYTHLGYKPHGRWGPVTDEETLLHYYAKDRNPIIRTVIQAVRARTRLQDIAKLVPDSDGRIRTSLDIVGTDTMRLSSRESMSMRPSLSGDGSWENTGTNLQNVTKELRNAFIPDSDQYDFWQFDLRGADAWTVAADLAALGHPTMLEDMLAGIKPAKVLMALLAEHESGGSPVAINALSRDALRSHLDTITIPDPGTRDPQGRPGDWKYDVCKKVQHGSNYGAQSGTISSLVFVDSDGLVDLKESEAALYQRLYKMRYKPDARNDWVREMLSRHGSLTAACGVKRKFFAIRNPRDIDDEIVRTASAFEPQCNTTHVTNRGLEALWYDRENRTSTGWLHCEPLLQIHDALAGQNHSSIRQWAHRKLSGYFDYPLTIHGIRVAIPADGGWGTSWQDTKGKLLK